MKKITAACLAMAAFAVSPAYGQDGTINKQCFKQCAELIPADKIKKTEYDYEAVESDPSKTDAEKKKSHKKAVVAVCTKICEQ